MNSTQRMPDVTPERPVRIASWNIHGAVGRDGRCRPERIAEIVDAMQADIVALQEVDGRTHLRRKPHAFETMAGLLGGTIVEARLIGRPGREHGHLVWTKFPVTRNAVHLLPGGWEQRGCIEAKILTPRGPLLVLATHLGLSPRVRRRQIRHILARCGESEANPTVLLGDLNEWMPNGPVHRTLTERLPCALQPPTFPAGRPFARLDRLYATYGLRFEPVRPPVGAAEASDHLPLVADLVF